MQNIVDNSTQPSLPPRYQKLYNFDSSAGIWVPSTSTADSISSSIRSQFRLLSWNIDFSRPRPEDRLITILNHLESLLHNISHDPSSNNSRYLPTLILFQELDETCFPTLLAHPLVRSHYNLTDVSLDSWIMDAGYGTVTLIPKSLSGVVKKVFRVPLPLTKMGRDALVVDLRISSSTLPSSSEGESGINTDRSTDARVVRIANVHLESLDGPGDRARPLQLASVARYLTQSSTNNTTVAGGIVAGDMNAISPVDKDLPERVGLVDAWKVKKQGRTDSAEGQKWEDREEDYTWGYQPRSRYGPSRLDKILYVGAVKVSDIQRVGIGLRVGRRETQTEGSFSEGDVWASDHYSLLATFDIDA